MVDSAADLAEEQKARVDPMYHGKIDGLLGAYARRLAGNMNDGYAIDARVPSVLVAGPANFPTKKKEKQNAARDRNMREWQEIQGLLDKIRRTGTGGISADDPEAAAKLKVKLESLEEAQETMKLVNGYYRKEGTLEGCPCLTREQTEKLKADMASGWHQGKAPYLPWQLSNNSAEIRRVKKRIALLAQKDQQEYRGWTFNGGHVEPDKADNRLRVYFDEKPDGETRAVLKSRGFRWSPRAGAWQRQLTDNALRAAGEIAGIQPLTGDAGGKAE